MRVSRGMLITVLLLAPGARGQVVPATGGDELASRLLGSLEALDVPADVWVVLSPE